MTGPPHNVTAKNQAPNVHLVSEIEQTRIAAENWGPGEVLRWAATQFSGSIAIASAFGAEGVVLIEIASRIISGLKVFILDTGFLFPETLDLMAKVERRYGIHVERVMPELGIDNQAEQYGPALWRQNPDLCCDLRKVQPLRKKLSTLKAWVTAIRRDQTPTRSQVGKVEWDTRFRLVKINPLADWTREMVWAYIREHDLACNPLHDQNYPSIGCTNCTRPVSNGEDQRAGRWPGFVKKECGLHIQEIAKGPIHPAAELNSQDDRRR